MSTLTSPVRLLRRVKDRSRNGPRLPRTNERMRKKKKHKNTFILFFSQVF